MPQISTVAWQGERIVAVRNRVYRSDRWKFFPDFLRDYVPAVLGMDWCKAEAAKSEAERHPIITRRAQAAAYMNAQPRSQMAAEQHYPAAHRVHTIALLTTCTL
jgi:hypothetical protein